MDDVWYRVFYDLNNATLYTDTYMTIEDARAVALFRKDNFGNVNVRIVEETITRRVIEVV